MSEIADGGAATDVVPVALLATEQRGDGERGAAVGSVLRGNETAKDPVCRQYFVGDRLCDGFAQAAAAPGRCWKEILWWAAGTGPPR